MHVMIPCILYAFFIQTKYQYLNDDITSSLLFLLTFSKDVSQQFNFEVNLKLKFCASSRTREGNSKSRSQFPLDMKKLNWKNDYHYILFVVGLETFFINLKITL